MEFGSRLEDLERADRFFLRFGSLAVLVARMPWVRFHAYTFIGSWPWCFLLAYVGMVLGAKWGSDPQLSRAFRYLDYTVAMILVFFVGRFVWHRWQDRHGGSGAA